MTVSTVHLLFIGLEVNSIVIFLRFGVKSFMKSSPGGAINLAATPLPAPMVIRQEERILFRYLAAQRANLLVYYFLHNNEGVA
ncbi:MAG: hypothetical protein KJ804_17900 [Proteobacteria bacterium]|nr:hypothetical protein [Pseudomonadota bacterium]MBU1060183.1 hypothetical protein [Pseudomonadota bacterium]